MKILAGEESLRGDSRHPESLRVWQFVSAGRRCSSFACDRERPCYIAKRFAVRDLERSSKRSDGLQRQRPLERSFLMKATSFGYEGAIAEARHRQTGSVSAELLERAERLIQQEIGFTYSDEFDSLTTERVEAAAHRDDLFIPPTETAPAGTPPYIAQLYDKPMLTPAGEKAHFRKMNFLRYRCNVLRSSLDVHNPDAAVIDSVEGMLAESQDARSTLAICNLRLVVAVARRLRHAIVAFDDRVAEGNLILLKAIDKFDYSRGFRFSTYATLSIQRHIQKNCESSSKYQERYPAAPHDLIEDRVVPGADNERLVRNLNCLDVLMESAGAVLDERERLIIQERYGLSSSRRGRPLRELSDQLGISKERVRQIQWGAVEKLFDFAIEQDLPLPN